MKDLIHFDIPSDEKICDLMMNQVALASVVIADELSIFEKLDQSSLNPSSLAEKLKSDERAVSALLNVLTSLGYLSKANSIYTPTEIARVYLKRSSPVYRGHQFFSAKDTWAYKRLMNMLKVGSDPISQGQSSLTKMWEENNLTQVAAQRFTEMMNTNIGGVATAIAKTGLFKEFESVVDIGGASGIFLAALRQLYPTQNLTLFELPQVCEAAKLVVGRYIDPSSIEYFPGSFFEEQFPLNKQAYFLSNVLHDWPKEKGLCILKNIYNALNEDGALFINEALLNEDRLSPARTVIFDLMMHLNHGAQQFTEGEIFELLKAAGFRDIQAVFNFGYYTTIRAYK